MTRRSLSGLALIAALVAGCVDAQPVPLAAGHPGSPQAAAGSVAAVEAFGQYQPAAKLALPAAAAPGMPVMRRTWRTACPSMRVYRWKPTAAIMPCWRVPSSSPAPRISRSRMAME